MRPLFITVQLLSLASLGQPIPPPVVVRVPETLLHDDYLLVPGTSCRVRLPGTEWEWRMWKGHEIYFTRPKGLDVYLDSNQLFVYPPEKRRTRRTSLEAYVAEKKAWMSEAWPPNELKVMHVWSSVVSSPEPDTYRIAIRYLMDGSVRDVRHYYAYLLPNGIEFAVWTNTLGPTAAGWNEPPLFRTFVESTVGCREGAGQQKD